MTETNAAWAARAAAHLMHVAEEPLLVLEGRHVDEAPAILAQVLEG